MEKTTRKRITTVPKCISKHSSRHGETTVCPGPRSHRENLHRPHWGRKYSLPTCAWGKLAPDPKIQREKHMHEPQIGRENLHIVPERKNGSPQEKSWVIVTERLSTCCVSNNNAEPSVWENIHTKSQIWIETHSIPLCGKMWMTVEMAPFSWLHETKIGKKPVHRNNQTTTLAWGW